MGELVVANEHPSLRVDTGALDVLARRVLAGEDCRWSYVGIILDGHEAVHALNREYLRHDYETDVLSFLIDEGPEGIEGEVYVDLDTAVENATRFDTTFEREVARYVVHGLLHLAGHDDADEPGRDAMRRLEDSYLSVADPDA